MYDSECLCHLSVIKSTLPFVTVGTLTVMPIVSEYNQHLNYFSVIRSPVSLSSDHTFHMHPFYVTVWMELICALRLSREPQWALFTVKLWPGRVFIANHQTLIINISWLHAIFPSKIKANKLITWKDGKGLLNRLKFRRVKRQIKKIWNNDFSPVICMIKLLSKARINFFFQNLSFHRLDVFT